MYQETYDFKQREVHIGLTQGFNPTGWDGEKWASGPNDIKDWDGGANTLHSVYLTKNANVTGLEPEITYYVRVVDVDKTGQRSEPSDEIQVIPEKYSGGDVTEIVWNSLHPTLQLMQITNRDPFIIQEENGSYGLRVVSGQKEYHFKSVKDTYTQTNDFGSSYSSSERLCVRNLVVTGSGGEFLPRHRETFIKFDINQLSLDASETIASAKIVLYSEAITGGVKNDVTVRDVTSDWSEDIGFLREPSFALSDLIVNNVSATYPKFVELSSTGLISWVNGVNNGSKINYGFRIWTNTSEDGREFWFRSREYRDPYFHPYLYVTTSLASSGQVTITPGTAYVKGQVATLTEPVTITPNPGGTAAKYIYADLDDNGNIAILIANSRGQIPAGCAILGYVVSSGTFIVSLDMSRSTGRREGNVSADSLGNSIFKSVWIPMAPKQRQEVIHGLGPGRYGYFLEQQVADGQPIYTRHMSGAKGVDVSFSADGKTLYLQGGASYTMVYLNMDGAEVNTASTKVRITVWKIADS